MLNFVDWIFDLLVRFVVWIQFMNCVFEGGDFCDGVDGQEVIVVDFFVVDDVFEEINCFIIIELLECGNRC